ncbi:hypothetical protein FHR53_003288 [Xanthomonas arboricola]
MLGQLRDRLARRPDSEHGQAMVRIVMILLILAYTLAFASHWQLPRHQLQLLLGMIAVGQAGAVLIFAWVVMRPRRSHLRRTLGMLADYGLIGLAMTWFGAPMACLSVVLLWVTIGNGLRFGSHALQTATAMGALSFGMTLANSVYWQQQLELAIALLGALVIIPMSLLRLLHEGADACVAPLPHRIGDAAATHERIPTPATPPRV